MKQLCYFRESLFGLIFAGSCSKPFSKNSTQCTLPVLLMLSCFQGEDIFFYYITIVLPFHCPRKEIKLFATDNVYDRRFALCFSVFHFLQVSFISQLLIWVDHLRVCSSFQVHLNCESGEISPFERFSVKISLIFSCQKCTSTFRKWDIFQ